MNSLLFHVFFFMTCYHHIAQMYHNILVWRGEGCYKWMPDSTNACEKHVGCTRKRYCKWFVASVRWRSHVHEKVATALKHNYHVPCSVSIMETDVTICGQYETLSEGSIQDERWEFLHSSLKWGIILNWSLGQPGAIH